MSKARARLSNLATDTRGQLIMDKNSFASLHASLEAFDGAIVR
jgi:hypothetical protein